MADIKTNQERDELFRRIYKIATDLVHAGHISSFAQAKALGDILIVGLNSDASIRRIKGEKRPIVDQLNRPKLVSAISLLVYIVIFDDDTPEKLVEAIIPDVLV